MACTSFILSCFHWNAVGWWKASLVCRSHTWCRDIQGSWSGRDLSRCWYVMWIQVNIIMKNLSLIQMRRKWTNHDYNKASNSSIMIFSAHVSHILTISRHDCTRASSPLYGVHDLTHPGHVLDFQCAAVADHLVYADHRKGERMLQSPPQPTGLKDPLCCCWSVLLLKSSTKPWPKMIQNEYPHIPCLGITIAKSFTGGLADGTRKSSVASGISEWSKNWETVDGLRRWIWNWRSTWADSKTLSCLKDLLWASANLCTSAMARALQANSNSPVATSAWQ